VSPTETFLYKIAPLHLMDTGKLLARISPSAGEKSGVAEKVEGFCQTLSRLTSAEVFVGGSYAKSTWLAGITDVDVFVRYSYKEFKPKSGKLSEILEASLKKGFKGIERLHGSRDYFRWVYKGLRFEIVPILKISKAEQAQNITDISPLHVSWVKAHANQKVREGVLLLKALLKAHQLYGAESYMLGLSGYVCEILVASHKGFDELLKAASKWKVGELVDPERAYKNKQDALMHLNTSKHGPLLLIDPVQATRNAAAALSNENFLKFVGLAQQFTKKRDEGLFAVDVMTKQKLPKNSVWMEVLPLNKKEDIAGAKMLACLNHIAREAPKYGFELLEKGWQWSPGNAANMWFVFKGDISKQHEVRGPPVSEKGHVNSFRKKHKHCSEKGGFLWATETREHTSPESFIKELIKDSYIKPRIARIQVK
jgi:tRNA CCA-adding enzyme